MIGRIKRLPLRSVWPHEEYNFSTWLRDNIDLLNETIDRELFNPKVEHTAGDFSVDIVAEDENGNMAVIENQLERSDHDHLGKLLTYKTALNAKIAIWIVSEPRSEHITAVQWLNEATDASFYLIKVEAISINDSLPAPLFTLIVEPSEEMRPINRIKSERSQRNVMRRKFYSGLLEKEKRLTNLHADVETSHNWIGKEIKPGLFFNYSILKVTYRGNYDAWVDIYIDRGEGQGAENKRIFDLFFDHKDEIESSFGQKLEWQRFDDKPFCRILWRFPVDIDDESKWGDAQDRMIDYMIRLYSAVAPFMERIDGLGIETGESRTSSADMERNPR